MSRQADEYVARLWRVEHGDYSPSDEFVPERRVICEDRRGVPLCRLAEPSHPEEWRYRIEQFYRNQWHPFSGRWMSFDDCMDSVEDARHFRSLADVRIVEDLS